MAQLTIYLPDETASQAKAIARNHGTSVGRWISELVANKVKDTWPPEFLAAIGAFPDFPEAETLRDGYGTDVVRESLD